MCFVNPLIHFLLAPPIFKIRFLVISSSESSEGNNSPNTSWLEEEIEKLKAIPPQILW